MEYLGTEKRVNKIHPVVSVCIQTYQHQEFIAECLDSILMQETDFAFEIILGEDDSNDGTRDICKEYAKAHPDKIRLFLMSDKDKIYINGIKTGRFNLVYGIYASRGKYIARCEGDDYWTDPLKLQKQVDILENNPNYILCHHWQKFAWKIDGSWVEKDSPILNQGYLKQKTGNVEDVFNNKLRLKTRTILFRNIFTELPLPEWLNKVAFADVPLSFILGEFGKFHFIDEPMAVYRQTDTGFSKAGLNELGRKKFNIQHYKNWIQIWDFADKHYDFKYHKEASETVKFFLNKILQNINDFNSIVGLFNYNLKVRKLPFANKMNDSMYLLRVVFLKGFNKMIRKFQNS